MKMLASTMQISNNNPTNTHTPHNEARKQRRTRTTNTHTTQEQTPGAYG